MTETSTSIIIDVPPRVIYDVVMDFEKYPDFLPDVKEVSIQGKRGKNVIVEFSIRVIKQIQYTLKMSGTPHKKIDWSLVKGDIIKKNNGGWSFTANGKEKTNATYSVDIDFGLFVPSMITSKLIGSSLPAMMKRFKDRAESLA